MKLYFLRHADAINGFDDAARPLSNVGVTQAKALARYLTKAGVVLDAAYSSPLVRARDTAKLVITESGSPAELELVSVLLNESLQYQFDDWLVGLAEAEHVLLVGHAPVLGGRARRLAGLANELLAMPKAGMACVETADRKSGELKFFVTPQDYM